MLIQDIKPLPKHPTPKEEDDAWMAYVKDTEIAQADNVRLIKELYDRGVTIRDIFGRYYEFEEAGNGRTMTVEDVLLAGLEGK